MSARTTTPTPPPGILKTNDGNSATTTPTSPPPAKKVDPAPATDTKENENQPANPQTTTEPSIKFVQKSTVKHPYADIDG